MNRFCPKFFEKFKLEIIALAVSILIYFIIGILLTPNYLFILNTDGVSYIHIAQNYISGHFYYAINGYWSPLYSWFLIPFLMIWQGKLGTLISIKLMSLFIGCFTFIAVYLLADRLNFDIKLKAITFFTLIPLILYFTFSKTTPDLLTLTLLLFYLNFLLDKRYIHDFRMGLLTGFFGALAFLSKSYIFFFFLVHFIIVNVDYWLKFKKNRKNISKNLILGLLVFLCISGIWIGLISEKYDKFTIGTSGTYNYAVLGPGSQGNPVYYEGLMKPYDKDAMSVWDNPSYIKVNEWSPLSSIENFEYQLQITSNDMLEIFKIIEAFSVLSILIIILAFFLIFKSSNDTSKSKLTLILLTIFIYSAGYCLIFVETRYFWFVDILLLLLGIFSIKILSEEYSLNKNLSMMLILLLCLSFVFFPIFNLHDNWGSGKEIYYMAENLKDYGAQGTNIAANSTDWRDTLILSYYLDAKYYGLTKPSSSQKGISEQLHNNKIGFFILWRNQSMNIEGYKELEDPGFSYPKVCMLKES